MKYTKINIKHAEVMETCMNGKQFMYMEREYNPGMNELVKRNLDRLHFWFRWHGDEFVYLPEVAEFIAGQEYLNYIVPSGKRTEQFGTSDVYNLLFENADDMPEAPFIMHYSDENGKAVIEMWEFGTVDDSEITDLFAKINGWHSSKDKLLYGQSCLDVKPAYSVIQETEDDDSCILFRMSDEQSVKECVEPCIEPPCGEPVMERTMFSRKRKDETDELPIIEEAKRRIEEEKRRIEEKKRRKEEERAPKDKPNNKRRGLFSSLFGGTAFYAVSDDYDACAPVEYDLEVEESARECDVETEKSAEECRVEMVDACEESAVPERRVLTGLPITVQWETTVKNVGADVLFNEIMASDQYIEATNKIYEAVEQLHKLGIGSLIIRSIARKDNSLSRIRIDDNYNITLPDYNNMTIEMAPMTKAVFLLFLRHEEGIAFKDLPDYGGELLALYWDMVDSDDEVAMKAKVERVTNPFNNAINEHCSRIKAAFALKFDDSLASSYYINGHRGEPKRISLPRKLVEWELY